MRKNRRQVQSLKPHDAQNRRQEPGDNRHRFAANLRQVEGAKPLNMQTKTARVWSL